MKKEIPSSVENRKRKFMKSQREIRIKKVHPGSKKNGWMVFVFLLVMLLAWIVVMKLLIHYRYPVYNHTKIVKSGLLYELIINRTLYRPGQPIELKLVLQNNSNKEIDLRFKTTERVNFIVQKELNFIFFHIPTTVWESSYDILARPIPNRLILKPKSKKMFEASWNQKDADGHQVSPGYYIISAHLLNTGSKTILELPAEMRK